VTYQTTGFPFRTWHFDKSTRVAKIADRSQKGSFELPLKQLKILYTAPSFAQIPRNYPYRPIMLFRVLAITLSTNSLLISRSDTRSKVIFATSRLNCNSKPGRGNYAKGEDIRCLFRYVHQIQPGDSLLLRPGIHCS
jgi:hypothetical protein